MDDAQYTKIGRTLVNALNLTSRGTIDEIKSCLHWETWKELILILETNVNLDVIKLPADLLEGKGLFLVKAFCCSGLVWSQGETRRIINQGGAYVNGRRVENVRLRLTAGDLNDRYQILLGIGGKNTILEFED